MALDQNFEEKIGKNQKLREGKKKWGQGFNQGIWD